MTDIKDAALMSYVDEKFAEMNRSISTLKDQLVTVIQSLEAEVKKSYNKDITIAQLRGEISTLEKMLDKYVSMSSELTNVKKIKLENEESSKNATPKLFTFGATHLPTTTTTTAMSFLGTHPHPPTTFFADYAISSTKKT